MRKNHECRENSCSESPYLGGFSDPSLADWQKIWVLAALSQVEQVERCRGESRLGSGKEPERARRAESGRRSVRGPLWRSHAAQGIDVYRWVSFKLYSSRDLLFFSNVAWRGTRNCQGQLECTRSTAQVDSSWDEQKIGSHLQTTSGAFLPVSKVVNRHIPAEWSPLNFD